MKQEFKVRHVQWGEWFTFIPGKPGRCVGCTQAYSK